MAISQQDYQMTQSELTGGQAGRDAYNKRMEALRAAETPPATPPVVLPQRTPDPLADPNKQKETDYYNNLDISLTPEEKLAHEKKTADEVQATIDSINNMTNQLISLEQGKYERLRTGEEQLGLERSGQTKAINARRGLSGSTFGEANVNKVGEYNQTQLGNLESDRKQAIAVLEADRQNKIMTAQNNSNQREDEWLAKEKELAATNFEKWDKWINDNKDKNKAAAEKDIALAASAGKITLEGFRNSELYNQYLRETGYSPLALDALFEKNTPKNLQMNYIYEHQYKGDNGNLFIKKIGLDINGNKQTFNYDLGIPYDQSQDYETPKILDNGAIMFVPKNWDGKDMTKIKILGADGQYANPKAETKNLELKSTIDNQLTANNLIGQDKKVAWETYKDMLLTWVNNNGTESEFYLNYPQTTWLDADNQAEFATNLGKGRTL